MLLVLWGPATSFCYAERAGWIDKDDCCTQSENLPREEASGEFACCMLASANYKVDEEQPATPLYVLSLLPHFLLSTDDNLSRAPDSGDAPAVAPPELRLTWQFSSRTALPPRAPSLVS